MSGLMHKIKDAVTGHHTTTNTTNTATTAHGTNDHLAHNNAAMAPGTAGMTGAHTAVGATPLGSAQVRDIPVEHNHSTATGAMKGGAAGALVGHPVAGAAAGAALGHHEHGTNSHLHSSSSSSMHSSHTGALGAGALGAGALAAGTHHNSSHVGTTGLATGAHTTGHEISHDNAMTRSEEHLLVGKEKVNVGQAALHKYVTTEHVSTAVPIIRERAVVEREPITDANRHTAMAGPDFKEAHYEVNLMEERAVAEKEAVPIERVRLRKEVEATQQYVEADLRKEHIEIVDGTQGKALVGAGVAGAAVNAAKSLESHHQTNQQMGASNMGAARQL